MEAKWIRVGMKELGEKLKIDRSGTSESLRQHLPPKATRYAGGSSQISSIANVLAVSTRVAGGFLGMFMSPWHPASGPK